MEIQSVTKASNQFLFSYTKCSSLGICISASDSPNWLKLGWGATNKFCLWWVCQISVIFQNVSAVQRQM